MNNGLLRAWLLCLSVTAMAASTYPNPSTHAQTTAVDPQPQLVYQYPPEGAVLPQPPASIQLCFASPINIKDLDKGGDFAFFVTEPDGIGIGNRDAFQRDGYGITVYPGNPVGDSAGEWKFFYRVTSPDSLSALVGHISYTVDPNVSPLSEEPQQVCVPSGGTATSLPRTDAPPTSGTGSVANENGGDSDDTLKYALIAAGVLGAAGILFVALVLRRRLGRRSPRPTLSATPPTPLYTADRSTKSPPVVESVTPAPLWARPPHPATPPPVAQSETPLPLPESRPPPSSATPPPVAQGGTPLPESSRPPGSATPPPVAQGGTPLPESSRPSLSETPPEASVDSDSAGHRPDNSKYALLAIATAVILLISLIFRRRGGRDQHRGTPGGDDGNHD